MKLNSIDIKWLEKYYPGLRVKNQKIIIGRFRFRAKINAKSKVPFVKPPEIEIWHQNPQCAQGKFYIEDCYEIMILTGENPYPCVYETGDRLKKFAEEIKRPLVDMHIFPTTEKLCLSHPIYILEIVKQGCSIQIFFEKLVIPYFYFHSYWQKFGDMPWFNLKHGDLGILEGLTNLKQYIITQESISIALNHLSDQTIAKLKLHLESGSKLKINDECFCNSGRKVKHCCKERAMKGFNVLLSAMVKSKLKVVQYRGPNLRS